MGTIYTVTCKNKRCRYHVELWEGPGMFSFSKMKDFERSIINGEVNISDVKERIENGAEIDTRGIYLCPSCKEFTDSHVYFLRENITESPYGTIRYDISFPFEKPLCEKCNSELIFIKNIRSSKIKCPKCGENLSSRLWGYFD